MRRFDVRRVPLLIAAGAFVGSALVSSVAEADDQSPPIDQPALVVEPAAETPAPATPSSTVPSPTDAGNIDTVDIDTVDIGAGDAVSGGVADPPFDDIAVVEMVMPEADTTVDTDAPETLTMVDSDAPGTQTVDETRVETAAPDIEVAVMDATDSTLTETTDDEGTPGDPAASASALVVDPPPVAEEPEEGHEGGSGGQGNPYRMTFTVIWLDPNGTPIAVLDAVVPTIDWRSMFELTAASETGKGMPTSATCTYPAGSEVLRCTFDNPGHGSGTDGLIVPARPTATYSVTVTWPQPDWTIEGANAGPYSARELCPCGDGEAGGGHEGGGGEEGDGYEPGGGGEEGDGHEPGGGGGEEGDGHEPGGGGRGVPCEHTVVLRQQAAVNVPPAMPPVVEPEAEALPPVVVEPEAEALPPVVAAPAATPPDPANVVAPTATAPQSLPTTGASVSMILLIAALLVAIGSVAAASSRRTWSGQRRSDLAGFDERHLTTTG